MDQSTVQLNDFMEILKIHFTFTQMHNIIFIFTHMHEETTNIQRIRIKIPSGFSFKSISKTLILKHLKFQLQQSTINAASILNSIS